MAGDHQSSDKIDDSLQKFVDHTRQNFLFGPELLSYVISNILQTVIYFIWGLVVTCHETLCNKIEDPRFADSFQINKCIS